MRLKTHCSNLYTANCESQAWRIVKDVDPDIATLAAGYLSDRNRVLLRNQIAIF